MKNLVPLCLATTLLLGATPQSNPSNGANGSSVKLTAKEISMPFITVAKNATPAVVFIQAETSVQQGFGRGNQDQELYEMFNDELFYRFFGGKPRGRGAPMPQLSRGSGFIISADGYVMTNFHVVKDATKINILLQSGKYRELPAKVIGGDPQTDIAILKIQPPEDMVFPYLEFGDSNALEVGEWVMAIGNPFELESTVTKGIVSAKGRQNLQITELEDFIQTDAVINPGNSGGPLLDLDGKVIGINTAIFATSGAYIGIGFAIPSRIAMTIRNQLIANGKVSRGFLGVSLQPIDQDLAESFHLDSTDGALISEVVKNSPADKAGLKQGDIITGINGMPIKSVTSLRNEILLKEPGERIDLVLLRDGKKLSVSVTIGTHSQQSESAQAIELGIAVDSINPDTISRFRIQPDEKGVVIVGVTPNSIADRSGLKPGFVIMAVNHRKVTTVKEFNEALAQTSDSKRALLLIKYGEHVRFYSIKTK